MQPRIDREGLAIICPSDYYLICMEAMKRYAPNAPRKEVTIVRKWLGQESRPEKFIIAIRLPK